jgi:hypothetical protein
MARLEPFPFLAKAIFGCQSSYAHFEHFWKLSRSEFCLYTTPSAENAEWMGHPRSRVKAKML